MSRMLSAFIWDVRTQFRQGLYYAGLFVLVVWTVILLQFPDATAHWLLPLALFIDLSVFGFYFMAGILFLEKGDGVLEALVVTPMRPREYLIAKVGSLTLIALLISAAVALIVAADRVQWAWLLIGVAMNSWLLALVGFMLAARYNAVNEFLIPSVLFTLPAQLPLLYYLGIWTGWPMYLVPTQPAMILLTAALGTVEPWKIWYSLAYLAVAIPVVTWLALVAFGRFVVRTERRA